MRESQEFQIERLGAQGDGIAEMPSGQRFVPFALPGERVRLASDETVEVVSEASRDRRAPLCRHFGVCGGCIAQHMSDRLYADWKRGIVVESFRHHGLAPAIGALHRVPPGTRRRAVLTARRTAGAVILGYHGRRSHDVFEVEECPVLSPAIVAQLPAIRAVAAAILVGEARFTVLATPVGLDVAVAASEGRLKPKVVTELARVAARLPLARLVANGETLVEVTKPALPVGGVPVVLPPGAFLQAVLEAESAMITQVVAAVGSKARRVADLFAGVGTFSYPLARSARVMAVDGDKAALAALAVATRHTQGLKPIETKQRDLFREPLSAKELEGYDAVVVDPPRAGARAQSDELARSKVPAVIAVSCNPATLARDARILVDGGYRLERVTPIDQFLFSAHVEAVAVFRRV